MPDPQQDPTRPADNQVAPATPGWVKLLGAVVLVLALIVVVVLVTGGAAGHGPGRHGG